MAKKKSSRWTEADKARIFKLWKKGVDDETIASHFRGVTNRHISQLRYRNHWLGVRGGSKKRIPVVARDLIVFDQPLSGSEASLASIRDAMSREGISRVDITRDKVRIYQAKEISI